MRRAFVVTVALVAAVALISSIASAGGWNHHYSDASGDVAYANIDIVEIKSYASGSEIILELTVAGIIENSTDITYNIQIIGQPHYGSVWYGNGGMTLVSYPDGGVNTSGVTIVADKTMRGVVPISHAGNASAFDIQGNAVYRAPSGTQSDVALNFAGGTGGPTANAWEIFGMAAWLFILILLVPAIIIVVVVAIVLSMKKKARASTPMQQPPYTPPH